jgi:CRISPR/Cas system-associated protein Csm6
MAKLPEETITTIFNLQQRLLKRIDEATATAATIFEQFGETEITVSELEQLDNIRERATSSYSRLYTLLLRVAEYQPTATSATLNLLAQAMEQAQATNAASKATIQEIKRDLNLP